MGRRGASRSVVNFMRAETFAPAALRFLPPTVAQIRAADREASNDGVYLAKPAPKPKAIKRDKVYHGKILKEEAVQSKANFEASRKTALLDNEVTLGKDIWGFGSAGGRDAKGRSNQANHISWKVRTKSPHQHNND